ncbi:hypothetical protein L596_008347 [Steinernema carpocapsae]|nr:hypothetical protein L596_008347 [Steinernema carpocapsae]
MPKPRPSIPAIVIDEDAANNQKDGLGIPESPPDSKNHLAAHQRGSRGSFSEEARRLTMKASELIIHVPVEQIKKIGETESMNSISRETEHFVGITTVHGPLRVYRGKGYYRYLWALALTCCVGLFLYQFSSIFQNFVGKPTVSQVPFFCFLYSPRRGTSVPTVTICNYNPVRKSYIKEINSTGEHKGKFTQVVLDYIIQSYADVQTIVENGQDALLWEGDIAFNDYKESMGENYTINDFFQSAGFDCEDIFKMCSFAGKQFRCCDFAKPTLTDMGKCFRLDLGNAQKEWLRMQTQAGVGNGLQIIADFHREEEIGVGNDRGLLPLFMNEFENGFRYFVHTRETIPYLATEGISVSPGARVYSAISSQKNSGAFIGSSCLSFKRELRAPGRELVGNCTNEWPPNYKTTVPYSATNCRALCRAAFFNSKCGCAPFIYNLGKKYDVCTPYDIFSCINKEFNIKDDPDGYTKLKLPQCSECKVECESWLYHTYNSYGQGFSVGALKWLQKKNANWTAPHVKSNFVAINIFFRDMSFTQYMQVQSVSLTQTFSDIGGNMGMFMGMSLLSIIEVVIWLSKISWVAISKKRRHYLVDKKTQEKEREKRLEETLKSRSATECTDDSIASSTREKLKRIAGSFRRKSVAAFDGVQHGIPTCSLRRRRFAKIGTSTTITPTGLSRYPLRRRPNRLGASWIRSSTRSCTELGERDERIAGRRPQLIRCWN